MLGLGPSTIGVTDADVPEESRGLFVEEAGMREGPGSFSRGQWLNMIKASAAIRTSDDSLYFVDFVAEGERSETSS